jgi:hypothetical protein
MNSQQELQICDWCLRGAHHDCAGTKERPCQCIICEGERIGDRVIGQPNDPPHHLADRFDPRPWRP